MNIYIQIILFTSIPLLIFYVFYLIKLNTKVEKENIKLSSSLKNKDIEIDSLSNQIKNNNEFSENLKNAVNTITGDIFEKKTKDFKEQNSENMKNILSPLQDEIKRFKDAFESVEGESKTSRAKLSQQIDDLLKTQVETNMSTDNLAMALRGDYKQQGDWGETQLKVILEKCGLREGYEYELQEEFKDDNNDRKRPDAIVKLPNDVVVPIDSKVSLNAYYDYANAIGSQYDRVLMFIPNEGAYYTAKQTDPLLDDFANKQNIGIVLHHTMYQTLKLINLMWTLDRQSKNAQEIANQGRLLMEKLDNSRDSFDKVGKHLENAQGSYSEALKQLFTGRGSLQDKAKKLEDLGIKSNKAK